MMGKLRINLTIQIGLRLAEAVACSGKKARRGKVVTPEAQQAKTVLTN
jgi:hypothetical protein